MNALQLTSVVERLHEGECPKCKSRLHYMMAEFTEGILDKNGMASTVNIINDKYVVYCPLCGYMQNAVHIGLKTIPIDRINKYDINWDRKYIEENILVNCEFAKNPFYKKGKE